MSDLDEKGVIDLTATEDPTKMDSSATIAPSALDAINARRADAGLETLRGGTQVHQLAAIEEAEAGGETETEVELESDKGLPEATEEELHGVINAQLAGGQLTAAGYPDTRKVNADLRSMGRQPVSAEVVKSATDKVRPAP